LSQSYTRREVGRILGLDARRLRYWERLRLVRPRARWGERFYNFGDLVAAGTVKRLTDHRIPARRVRRAVTLVEQQFGESPLALEQLRILEQGRELLLVPPGATEPFNPIRRQWAFSFLSAAPGANLRPMAGRSPEELFEAALECERQQEMLPEAIDTYRRVVELAPEWLEAHVNLGVAYYQLGQLSEACAAFRNAVQLDPISGVARYNLGCTLEEQGEYDEAIEHLERAALDVLGKLLTNRVRFGACTHEPLVAWPTELGQVSNLQTHYARRHGGTIRARTTRRPSSCAASRWRLVVRAATMSC